MAATKKLNSQNLLAQLVTSKNSGCLELDNGKIYWKIYLQQGNLKYIYCSTQLLEQLEYYLCCLKLKKLIAPLRAWSASNRDIQPPKSKQNIETTQNFYNDAISWLVKERYLTLSQASQFIQHITKDELRRCLWLDSGIHRWYDGNFMPKTILGNSPPLNLSKYLSWELDRLEHWQTCNPELFSVHQRPCLVSNWEEKTLPVFGALNYQTLRKLSKIINGRASIRQLSLLLHKDELEIAHLLSPYIEDNIMYLRNPLIKFSQFPAIPRLQEDTPKSAPIAKINKIVCIDDSPTILKEIKRFLEQDSFEITIIEDPAKAVSQIFAIDPDLILLDINMPRVNGYELCKLLRKSGECDRTSIIMVTGNNGFIDKARAKIVGANDYLTKPFSQVELINLVNKYL